MSKFDSNTILLGGDERQQKEFLPKLAAFDWQGCFALTEPLSGSDIVGGLATKALLCPPFADTISNHLSREIF